MKVNLLNRYLIVWPKNLPFLKKPKTNSLKCSILTWVTCCGKLMNSVKKWLLTEILKGKFSDFTISFYLHEKWIFKSFHFSKLIVELSSSPWGNFIEFVSSLVVDLICFLVKVFLESHHKRSNEIIVQFLCEFKLRVQKHYSKGYSS